MRFGINLRGDLAKLSDAEIATTFETLMAERESMHRTLPGYSGNKWLYQSGFGSLFGRGLLHARIFYKFYALQYFSFGKSSLYKLYLLDCELKDVRDELKRRVGRQNAVLVRS